MIYNRGVSMFAHALFLFSLTLAKPVLSHESGDVWRHMKTDYSSYDFSAGFISKENFQDIVKNDLNKNSEAFIACRFPARTYLAFKDTDKLKKIFKPCSALNEFRRKVPFENLSIAFAAEDLSAPASNMGHVFLQVSGNTQAGKEKSYGISFLTNTKGNPISLGYSLLIGGSNGIVTLGQADLEIAKYVDLSKRTVWTVSLDTTDIDLEFLQLYIWELRQNTPKYFFVQFNCATFIHHVISLSKHNTFPKRYISFVTPRELFKSFSQDRKPYVRVYPSIDWFIHALAEEGEPNYKLWESRTNNKSPFELNQSLSTASLLFAINYTEKLRRQNKLTDDDALDKVAYLNSNLILRSGESEEFLADNIPLPESFFPPSRVTLSLLAGDNSNALLLCYRPAAIDIFSSQPLTFGVQENNLAQTIISINDLKEEVKLEQFDVFAMSSLRPWSRVSKEYSFRTGLGFSRGLDNNKKTLLSFKGGIAHRISDDVLVYGLIGAGLGDAEAYSRHEVGLVELGAVVNLVAGLNLWTGMSQNYWGTSKVEKEKIFSLIVQKKLPNQYSLDLSYQHEKYTNNKRQSFNRLAISVSKYF